MGAHPRSRGENAPTPTAAVVPSGSSPLTRGKRAGVNSPIYTLRLIPAHAGKTCSGAGRWSVCRAHPRSRGENSQAKTIPARGPGSSPLTRGKLPGENDPRAGAGLIPAHAGKTGLKPPKTSRSTAHPRSRGENPRGSVARASTRGSSPLTRGKRSVREDERTMTGLIPAHAGKTPRPTLSCRRVGGSSPLTRGKPTAFSPGLSPPGLIPAHAGKTLAWAVDGARA